MTVSTTVQLSCEADDLIKALEQLLSEFTEGSPEIRESLFSLFQGCGEAGFVEVDTGVASATDQMVIRFNPSERLLMALAAIRTGDWDFLAVEHGHGETLATQTS